MRTIEGGEVTAKELGLLEPDETAKFAARPMYVTSPRGDRWSSPLLLLTDRRLVVSKERFLGKRRADYSAGWSGVATVTGRPWNGVGPLIELVVESTDGDLQLLVQPSYAVDVESAIRSGYMN